MSILLRAHSIGVLCIVDCCYGMLCWITVGVFITAYPEHKKVGGAHSFHPVPPLKYVGLHIPQMNRGSLPREHSSIRTEVKL